MRGFDVNAIVLDTGTTTLKAGYTGRPLPSMLIPSLVGYMRTPKTKAGYIGYGQTAVGETGIGLSEEPAPEDRTEAAPLPSAPTPDATSGPTQQDSSCSPPADGSPPSDQNRKWFDLAQIMAFDKEKEIERPVTGGSVTNTKAATELWGYVLQKLQPRNTLTSCGMSSLSSDTLVGSGVTSSTSFQTGILNSEMLPVLISEPYFTPLRLQKTMLQVFFEEMNVPAVAFYKSAVLAALTAGRHTACVVECGGGYTSVVPVIEGNALSRKAVKSNRLNGELLEDCMAAWIRFRRAESITSTLTDTGVFDPLNPQKPTYTFQGTTVIKSKGRLIPSYLMGFDQNEVLVRKTLDGVTQTYKDTMDRFLARDVFQELCTVSETGLSFSKKTDPTNSVLYTLPDGTEISCADERQRVPEIYFNPAEMGQIPQCGDLTENMSYVLSDRTHRPVSLQSMIHRSIATFPDITKKELFNAIVPSGGITALKGFHTRLRNELESVEPLNYRLRIVTPSWPGCSPSFLPWCGGSVIASLALFSPMWISKEEFYERGINALEDRY